jgi:hypothetical protein
MVNVQALLDADSPAAIMCEIMPIIQANLQERSRRVRGEEPEAIIPWDSGTVEFMDETIQRDMEQLARCWDVVKNHKNSWLVEHQHKQQEAGL